MNEEFELPFTSNTLIQSKDTELNDSETRNKEFVLH